MWLFGCSRKVQQESGVGSGLFDQQHLDVSEFLPAPKEKQNTSALRNSEPVLCAFS